EKPITADEARAILSEAPGCLVIDKREDGGYITPVECAGEDATYISRIREDSTIDNGLNLWIVSDNLRKGAALNTVQIAELLGARGLIQPRQKAAWSATAPLCGATGRPAVRIACRPSDGGQPSPSDHVAPGDSVRRGGHSAGDAPFARLAPTEVT